MSIDRAKLVSEMKEAADFSFTWGRNNNVTDVCLSIVAVFASLVAAVLAAQNPPTWPLLVATFAALPAACAALRQIVGFQRRSYWHFEYGSRLQALALELEFAKSPDIEDIAKRRGQIRVEMERAWPRMTGAGDEDRRDTGAKKETR